MTQELGSNNPAPLVTETVGAHPEPLHQASLPDSPSLRPSLRDRLNEGTKPVHKAISDNSFFSRINIPAAAQQSVGKVLTKEQYLQNLKVLHVLHQGYEAIFESRSDDLKAFGIDEKEHRKSPLALEDINFISKDSPDEFDKAKEFLLLTPEQLGMDIESISASLTNRFALLGAFYTVNGSANGNQLAANVINELFGFTNDGIDKSESNGVAFLDWGSDIPIDGPRRGKPTNSSWDKVVEALGLVNANEEEFDVALVGAKETFEVFGLIATNALELSNAKSV